MTTKKHPAVEKLEDLGKGTELADPSRSLQSDQEPSKGNPKARRSLDEVIETESTPVFVEPLPSQSTPEPEDVLRNIDQLSRGAFTAFAERMQYKDYSDMSLPLYHEMTAGQKAAWESVVRVVYGALP